MNLKLEPITVCFIFLFTYMIRKKNKLNIKGECPKFFELFLNHILVNFKLNIHFLKVDLLKHKSIFCFSFIIFLSKEAFKINFFNSRLKKTLINFSILKKKKNLSSQDMYISQYVLTANTCEIRA